MRAMITGASGGLGKAIATKLQERGYSLYLVDFDAEGLSQMAVDYPGCEIRVLDQRDSSAVEFFCSEIIEGALGFDVAIINAGSIVVGDLVSLAPRQVSDQIQINLTSSALLIQALSIAMSRMRCGHILATVSMGGIMSLKGSATYSASKFGLRGLLWGLRDELSSTGVHITGIYPGGIDTKMLRHEAASGGSALNFVSTPVSAEAVAEAFVRAIDRPRLEVYVPMSAGFTGRLAAAFPGLSAWFYPLLERIGEAGRRKYLAQSNH